LIITAELTLHISPEYQERSYQASDKQRNRIDVFDREIPFHNAAVKYGSTDFNLDHVGYYGIEDQLAGQVTEDKTADIEKSKRMIRSTDYLKSVDERAECTSKSYILEAYKKLGTVASFLVVFGLDLADNDYAELAIRRIDMPSRWILLTAKEFFLRKKDHTLENLWS
jgi:hypothetical protein